MKPRFLNPNWDWKEYVKYRVGIDLSTKNIGVAIIKENQVQKVDVKVLCNRSFDQSTILEFKWYINWLSLFLPKDKSNVEVYIEIGNFGNPKMTQKFSLLLGIIKTLFWEQLGLEVKPISNASWFVLLAKDNDIKVTNKLKREDRKKISVKLAKQCFHINEDNDDIADALWIAHYGNRCDNYFKEKENERLHKRTKRNNTKSRTSKRN